ncbi:MAG TPA: thioredoxin family protein [Kiritimatiellia bacterium]|mgnify:FL=1|nr:thioredoxin family protein [Kiritimatiellia bacterium]HMP95874.1 thioredoxin family protein [Kiritimatiellia bacterium]
MKKLLMTFVTMAATAAFSHAATLSIGEPAPDFTLTDTHGASHNLSDFKGKYVVLEWINHGCPFVVKFYKEGHMQALQREHTEKGVVWLSICSSAEGLQGHMSPEAWNAKNEEIGAAATAVLLDEDGVVGRKYGARTTPHMYVIDPEGLLVYQGAIDSIRSTNPEDIEGAENYVVAALAQHMAGEAVVNAQTTPYGCSVKYRD